MRRIAIIGGGISGLSAAFRLEKARRAGTMVDFVLYESGPRFGGVLRTEHIDGCVVEAGPDSFLSEKSWASDFCRELGLGEELIASNDRDRKTYIVVKGRLLPIPDGLVFMVPTKILSIAQSPLFSLATKARMAREWFHPRSVMAEDETVSAFVARHYGDETVERLADPLLSGVYGGTASELSVRAVLPRLVEMEKQYGSLGRGMLAVRKKSRGTAGQPAQPIFTSLRNGMQQLADGILAQLPPHASRLNSRVEAIAKSGDGWRVSTGMDFDRFDALILAIPAPAASAILQPIAPELSTELGKITYSSSVTVALEYDQSVRSALPPGFGFLVPRSEGKHMLAATFVHNKFSHRAPAGRALLRCFLGGSSNEQILTASEEEIVSIVRLELNQILGIAVQPLFTRVFTWHNAMAQYNVGHLQRLDRIERLSRGLPWFALAGNAYRGIGIPDCIRSGDQAAAQVIAALGLSPAANEPAASRN